MTLQEAVAAVPDNTSATIMVLDGEWAKPNIPTTKKIKIEKYSKVTIK